MDEQELKKLQRYIGKRDKGETTEEIITHIRKMMEGEAWKEETWNQLLIPTCSSGDVVLFRWLLEQGACLKTVMHELPGYVIYSQEKRLEYQKKRQALLEEAVSLIDKEDRSDFLGEALKQACWYNNIYVVEYLVNAGGDLQYTDVGGKTPYEYAKIYGERFDDYTLYHYLQEFVENKGKGWKLFGKKKRLADSEKFFSGKDMLGNSIYEKQE